MLKSICLALLSGTLSAAIVNYSYDAAARLVKIDYGTGGSIVYTYDNAGNVLTRTIVSAQQMAAMTANAKGVKKPQASLPPKTPVKP